MLAQESKLNRTGQFVAKTTDLREPVKRCSLETARIAGGCKMSESQVSQILVTINKAIGHFLLQEHRNVMLDLDIQRGMVLFFDGDRARFVEKTEALKDQVLAVIDDSRGEGGPRPRRMTEANLLANRVNDETN